MLPRYFNPSREANAIIFDGSEESKIKNGSSVDVMVYECGNVKVLIVATVGARGKTELRKRYDVDFTLTNNGNSAAEPYSFR